MDHGNNQLSSTNNGQNDRNLQVPGRQTAPQIPERSAETSQVLRDKIETIYEYAPPNQLKDAADSTTHSPYNRTYANSAYNWQQYHTAWQQYYQQYYQRYYLQQVHLQRQQAAAKKAELAAKSPPASSEGSKARKTQTAQLKRDLLDTVKERAQKVRHGHHFAPIVSAILVGLVFLFLQYNRFLFAEVEAYISPGSTVHESDTVLVDPSANLNVGSEPKLIIPKINVNIRVVYDVTSLENSPVQEGLKRGVVHYKLPGANSLPGQIGNTVLLGHSSNDIFDPGDYKFAFVLLDRLQDGDVFYIHYDGKRYIYRVTGKKVILPTELSALQINNGRPNITLVTCTPLGTALKRLLVTAEQISPDPATAQEPGKDTAKGKEPAELPANSPTFLERVRDFFF